MAPGRPEHLEGRFDGPMIRLKALRGRCLHLQPTRYFDHWATNLQSQPPAGPCADPLGINGLVFDVHGRLVLNRRSAHLHLRPGQLAPGFSGALEPRDLLGKSRIKGEDLLREYHEELHPPASWPAPRLRLLGLVRERARHGNPDLFVLCELPGAGEELRGSTEGQPLILPPPHDPQTLAQHGPLSIPLQTALKLWEDSRDGG